MSAWRDGELLAGAAADLARDRGLLLGDGLFETVLVRSGSAPLLDQHLERMRTSAAALGLRCPGDLAERVAEALDALFVADEHPERAALRVTLSAGSGRGLDVAMDSSPGLTVSLSALAPRAPGELPHAATAVIVKRVRVDPDDPLAGHKTLSALRWVLARREARSRRADVGLLRTVNGDVCEADCANVFAVINGVTVTPALDSGVLPGITRQRVLDALEADGREFELRALDDASLREASEVFLTSSLEPVRPIARIDASPVPAPGSVAAWLAGCL